MKNDFVTAISQLSAEKNLDAGTVFAAVEAAMASAFKKDELQYAEIEVKIDVESGDIEAWRVWDVMPDEDIEDDEIQVSPERAIEMGHGNVSVGERIREPMEATLDAGRIAAQTAKQVVLQRLREAEREAVFGEFTTKQGELVSGTILRVEAGRRNVVLDLGRAEAVLPSSEQVRPEHYRVGQRLRVYVKEVYRASKGPQVVASRSHPELLKRLLELEIPEVGRGAVEIISMSREPGYRSKIAVISRQDGVDPVGAVVGVRGARIQNVVNELGGERVDVVRWDPNELGFIANALSPAEVVSVRIDEGTNTAHLAVPDKQLSLAIGKDGQNARLAARLSGRRIEISSESTLIHNGEDLFPPPEPNMDAIPLAPVAGMPTSPAEVAPSQADYARPGLPGEREFVETPAAEMEPAQLTPEEEVLAEFAETTVEETVEEVVETTSAPEPVVASPSGAGSGLRFAEEIGELRDLDEEGGGDRPARRGQRSRRRGPATPERERQPRGGRRRFEIDEEDIEAGLSELHGDQTYEDEYDEFDEYEDE